MSAARRFGFYSLVLVPTKEEVTEALKQVEDPELGMDIVDLGLLYDVEIEGPKVKVIHSLTSMGCPAGPMIQEDIHNAAASLDGVEDVNRVFGSDDLAPGEVIVVATGVSNGDLLRGVRFLADSARTHSLVMCMRCNWVRFTDGIHFFARERKEEVRLLG